MTEETDTLHMFYIGDADYVSAPSVEQAGIIWEKETGCSLASEEFEVVMVSDERTLAVTVDVSGEPCEDGDDGDDGATLTRRTAYEWANALGEGFAFSEEY